MVSTSAARYAQEVENDRSRRWSVFFLHVVFTSCILLQKFGLVFGDSYIAFSFPVFVILCSVYVIKGYVRFSSPKLATYAIIIMLALTSSIAASISENSRNLPFSFPSLLLFSALYSLLCVNPTRKFDIELTLKVFVTYGRIVTILGILQPILEKLGLVLSSLGAVAPFLQPLLIENRFNTNAFISYGESAMRSNGIVMLEPSYFSQLIVLSATAEALFMRRYIFLPLYAVGYALSYSGTGAIAFILAVILYAFLNPQRLNYVLGAAVISLFGLGIGGVVFPDTVGYFIGRLGEFGAEGSSAYVRYIAQSIVWRDMSEDGRLLLGHGAGSYERLYGNFGISSNPVLKFTFEYGLATALLICTFVLSSILNRKMILLSLILFVMYMTAGTTELNPNFMIMTIMLGAFTEYRSCRVRQAKSIVSGALEKRVVPK